MVYVSRSPSGEKSGFGQMWPKSWQILRRNVGWGGCHMGRQELGCKWVDPYRPQDTFPGLVGPFGAMGGRFGAILHIENADATPPHLDVFMRLGSSADLHGSLQDLCKGGAQLMHEHTSPNRLECTAKAGPNTNSGQPKGIFGRFWSALGVPEAHQAPKQN